MFQTIRAGSDRRRRRGGSTTARELRALGYDGPLTLVNGERERPYNVPPLTRVSCRAR